MNQSDHLQAIRDALRAEADRLANARFPAAFVVGQIWGMRGAAKMIEEALAAAELDAAPSLDSLHRELADALSDCLDVLRVEFVDPEMHPNSVEQNEIYRGEEVLRSAFERGWRADQ